MLKVTKPTNELTAKLADFGLAMDCYDPEDGEPDMLDNSAAGTTLYMSPQVLQCGQFILFFKTFVCLNVCTFFSCQP